MYTIVIVTDTWDLPAAYVYEDGIIIATFWDESVDIVTRLAEAFIDGRVD
jgi:hypothetical protein